MCPSLEQLERFADGGLSGSARTALERHLNACASCRARAAEIENNLRAARLVAALGAQPSASDRTETQAAPQGVGPGHSATVGLSLPPDAFPGYEIRGEISRGGQGVVYRAAQQSTRREVAIKVMRHGPFVGAHDHARFDREVRLLAQLRHPNIVAVHDSGLASGHFYYVMDYIDGRPLDEYWEGPRGQGVEGRREPESPAIRDALALFVKICDAVNAAHLRGIIHRDLKPTNILVTPDGEPHILDFGLAKTALRETDETSMTHTGDFVGSLPWASPEQAEGATDKIDLRTDVYSLGMVLYRMLTGQFPYGVQGNLREMLDRIVHDEPLPPSAFREQIDDEIETIVLKCLNKEPERRYQSAGELARDVRHYLAGEPIEAKRDSLGYVLRKQLRRHKLPMALAAVFLLLLTGGFFTSLTFWRQAVLDRDRAREAERQRNQEREAAERARQAEQTQRTLAEASEAKARQRFEAMSRLARSFMLDFNDRLYRFVGAAPPRAFLLQNALNALASLEREIPDDPALHLDWGLTYLKVGDVQSDFFGAGGTPDLPGALASYCKALEIFEALAAAYPNLDLGRREQAAVHQRLGHVFARLGRARDALDSYRRGLELREALFAREPPARKAAQSLWLVHERVGALLAETGKTEEALAAFRQAQTWFGALTVTNTGDEAARRAAALAYRKTAETQAAFAAEDALPKEWRRSAWREAREGFQRSLAVFLELRRDGLLPAAEENAVAQLTTEIARCDAALAALEAAEEPSAAGK